MHSIATVSIFVAKMIQEGFTGLGLKGTKEKMPQKKIVHFPKSHLYIWFVFYVILPNKININ